MPLTTTNKVINLLLVGSLVLLVLALTIISNIGGVNVRNDVLEFFADLPSILAVSGAFILLPVVVLFGAVIEGIAGFTIRPVIRKIQKHRKIALLFGRPKTFDDLMNQKNQYVALLKKTALYFHLIDKDQPEKYLSAVGILFNTASTEHVQWTLQHYATYNLVSQFIVVMLLAWPLLPKILSLFNGSINLFLVNLGYFLSIYSLISLAIARSCYSYELAYRQANLHLLEKHVPLGLEQPLELEKKAIDD